MLIDTHAHLFAEQFSDDIDEVIDRAKKVGVKKVILPNIDQKSTATMLRLHQKYPDYCYPAIGLHPCSVEENYESVLIEMEPYFKREEIIAVGETGIDLYWDKSTKEAQLESFRKHIEWSIRYGIPIIIHSRNALDITIEEITKAQDGNLRGIFHCFTGNWKQARAIKDLGFMIGIGGVLTFKNSGLDKVMEEIGIENTVLETDAPYLSPSPHRGKRNESAYVKLVAEKLAFVTKTPLEEIIEKTGINALNVFGKQIALNNI